MKREKLIKKREEKGYTQEQVARAVGISKSHYSHIELGSRLPAYDIMMKIANFFNVKPDYFFYNESLL